VKVTEAERKRRSKVARELAIAAQDLRHYQRADLSPHRGHQAVRSQLTSPSGDRAEVPNRPSHPALVMFCEKSVAFDVSDH
jgi:hypothetical protein